jgi:lipopolysaccharide transport system ATP-binding protein
MSSPSIQVSNLSKEYRLGEISTGVLFRDLNRWWCKVRGRPDPYSRIKESYVTQHRKTDTVDEKVLALSDISFEVFPSEVVGIIGRNGAGKSTLLKVLSRVTAPTSGSVKVRGRMASLLEVGTGFHPELTGRENIFLNGAILGMSRRDIRSQFDQIVDFSGCEKYIDTPVKRYSSGMYVRLAFSVAAHLRTDILIVDEVLAVGDMEFQKKCLARMGEVANQGRTVLVVSHNMASISNLCSRAILIRNGEVQCDGLVEEVVPRYLQSGADRGGEFRPNEEDRPRNEKVELVSVEVTQDNLDGPSGDVDISQDIVIRITYRCLQSGCLLYPAIWLKDSNGIFVLCSGNAPDFNSQTDPWWGKAHKEGEYVSEGRLPGNFLNNGSYYLTPIIGSLPSNPEILLEDLVSFHVHETGERNKMYYGKRLGVVHPYLPWSTVEVNDDIIVDEVNKYTK